MIHVMVRSMSIGKQLFSTFKMSIVEVGGRGSTKVRQSQLDLTLLGEAKLDWGNSGTGPAFNKS